MVKFILLGHGRCGSTLVTTSLATHPHILMLGELFNNEIKARRAALENLWKYPDIGQAPLGYYRDGEDAAEFIKKRIFVERPAFNCRAFGFKIFYNQAQKDRNSRKAWDYLIDNKDIRIIHLKRDNLLSSWLSLQIAFETDEWIVLNETLPQDVQTPSVTLNPIECQTYFEWVTMKSKWASEVFCHHLMLEVKYETDLCESFQSTMGLIQEFIGVYRCKLPKITRKQGKYRLSEKIANYEEIKTHFRDTVYLRFFE